MLLARKTFGCHARSHSRWLGLGLALAGVLCCAPLRAAEPAAPEPRNDKYLFIVDTSRAMKGMKSSLQQALGDLVHNGLEGWMHNGDTFGVWTFADRISTDYPMQIWREKDRELMASEAAKHISKLEFAKRGHLKSALPHMFSVIGTVKDVTVIILTDGDETVQGTEYDAAIKTALGTVKDALRQESRPAIIALVARGGRIVRWGVNSPTLMVPLPKAPPRPAPAPSMLAGATNAVPLAPTAVSVTNTTTVPNKTALATLTSNGPSLAPTPPTPATPENSGSAPGTAMKPAAKPVATRAPIIMTRETISARTWLEPLDGSSPVPAPAVPPAAPTNSPVAAVPIAASPLPKPLPEPPRTAATVPLETNSLATSNTNAAAAVASVASIPGLPQPGTGQTMVATMPPAVAPLPAPTGRRPESAASTGPVSPAASTPAPGSTLPGTILIALGAMCTGLALGLLWMRRHAARQQPSLITRSLSRSLGQAVPEKARPAAIPPDPAPLTVASPQG
jgi:hypothetical protein